ncbi:hypothetical protein BJV77DRAFT_307549 [Russula vinacea]|jgi:hypothetical protein|nr:hypothetical protein BJV77DRAFT_307549 [Russula vinacea]
MLLLCLISVAPLRLMRTPSNGLEQPGLTLPQHMASLTSVTLDCLQGVSTSLAHLACAAERPKGRPERGLMHIALPYFCYLGIKRPKHDTKLGCQARTMARPVTVPQTLW